MTFSTRELEPCWSSGAKEDNAVAEDLEFIALIGPGRELELLERYLSIVEPDRPI
jgi:hypothetical protein